MKHTKRILSVLLALVMTLGLLPFSAFAATTITQVDITGFVVPKEGDYGTPNLAGIAVPENAPYTLDNCFWFNRDTRKAMTSSETFTDGTVYFVTFKITPKAGFEFSQNVSVTINGSTELFSSRILGDTPTDTMTAYSAFFSEFEEATEPITSVDVVNFKTPVVGQTEWDNVSALAAPDDAHYTVEYMSWHNNTANNFMAADEAFQTGSTYYVRISLKADDGYEFDSSNMSSICLNGSSDLVDLQYSGMDNGLFVIYSVDLEPTPAPEGEVITSVDVSGYAAPVIGQSLAGHMHELFVSNDAPYVIADVGWYYPDSEVPLNDFTMFEKDQTLILKFTLAPVEGYYFDDDDYPNASINDSDELIGLGTGYWVDTQGLFHFETVEITPVAGELTTVYGITVNGYQHPLIGQTVGENLATLSVPDDALYFIYNAYWCYGDETEGLDEDYVFDEEETYRLHLEFRLKGKGQFDSEEFQLTATGITVGDSEFYGAGYYFKSVKVSPIAPGDPIPVGRVTVTGVQLPVLGQQIGDNIGMIGVPAGATYTIDVDNTYWTTGGEELAVDYTFREGEIYVLHVNVIFLDGYMFDMINGEIPTLFLDSGETMDVDEFLWQAAGKTVYIPSVEMTADPGGSDVLWGDANGDGKVDNKDIVRLKNYVANYDDETGVSSNGSTTYTLSPGADATGDGKVDNKDIVRLKNYIANYDDETGISSNGTTTYILGPDSNQIS